MTKEEALELLGKATRSCNNIEEQRAPDVLLREALAQPPLPVQEQRPCRNCDGTGNRDTGIEESPIATCKRCKGTGQINTTPPQRPWVGLTDEDFQPMVQKAMVYYGYKPEHSTLTSGAGFYVLVRAVEAKLKQKNGYAEEKNT